MRTCRALTVVVMLWTGLAGAPAGRAPAVVSRHWVVAWTSSMAGGLVLPGSNYTCREIERVAVDGDAIRVRLSNQFGTAPLTFGAAYVGLRATGLSLVPGTNDRLTFDRSARVTIPPGQEVTSDPVALPVRAQQDLAVSLYVPGRAPLATYHPFGLVTSGCTNLSGAAGDHTADTGGAAFGDPLHVHTGALASRTFKLWVTAVDVATSSATGAIVALGDSITDGYNSTVDGYDDWVDVLGRRLLALPPGRRLSLVNAGISGNSVMPLVHAPEDLPVSYGPAAIERLDGDVLAQAGVRVVILFEGTNDINSGASAAQVIAGLQQIVTRVRARRLTIIGATLIPRGHWSSHGPAAPVKDATRDQVNAWIRACGHFDAVIDFDAVLRAPDNPEEMNPAYDSGDHIHPGPAGYAAMGNAVNLSLFTHGPSAACSHT